MVSSVNLQALPDGQDCWTETSPQAERTKMARELSIAEKARRHQGGAILAERVRRLKMRNHRGEQSLTEKARDLEMGATRADSCQTLRAPRGHQCSDWPASEEDRGRIAGGGPARQ